MKTLYIGCSLAHASAEFLQFIDELKIAVAKDFEPLTFVGLNPDATAALVYTTDIDCAKRADLMLAIADHPSTGLGMEIQARIYLEKTTVIAFRQGTKISRMVLGAVEISPVMSTLPYESIDDIVEVLKSYV
jgi:hypothetical protein